MVITTRTKFREQLQEIQGYLERLEEKCAADALAVGLAAAGDRGAAEGVIEGRKAEDRLRSAIEQNCLEVMLLQQPLIGEDLRFVTGAFRVVSDLSHIDGMCRDAAYLSCEVTPEAVDVAAAELTEMSELCASMVRHSGKAFATVDTKAAQNVINQDARVNALYSEVEKKIVTLIKNDAAHPRSALKQLMLAKYFERIGDLCKRVANWATFRATGKHTVQHKSTSELPDLLANPADKNKS